MLVPLVYAILNPKVTAAKNVKLLLKPVGHFTLPLESKVSRADDEHPVGQTAQLEFLEQQARHDGFAGACVVGQQESHTCGLEQVIVNGVQLVRQRVNA